MKLFLAAAFVMTLLAALPLHAETLLYCPFDNSLTAELASGTASPIGAEAAVQTLFVQLTKGGQGVKVPGQAAGEALDLASARGRKSSLSFESAGNINTQAGTMQCWVKLMFDLEPMRGKDRSRSFMWLKTRGGTWQSIGIGYRDFYYEGRAVGPHIFFGINDGTSRYMLANVGKLGWKKDEWHHVMAVWDAKTMRLFLDGVQRKMKVFPEEAPYKPTPAAGPIVVGKGGPEFPMLIDELRIDDEPLVAENVNKVNTWELPIAVGGGAGQEEYRPVVPCAKVGAAPQIDGRLSDTCWREAVRISGLTAFGSTRRLRFVDVQTSVSACHDGEALYLAFVCLEPYMELVEPPNRKHDGPVWRDDGIEIYLCSDPKNPKLFYQFIISAVGSKYDGKGPDDKWNGAWKAAATRSTDRYFIEVAVPWATLGRPSPETGTSFPMNFGRNRYVPGGELSSLATVAAGYSATSFFGTMHFLDRPDGLGSEAELNGRFTEMASSSLREALEGVALELKAARSFAPRPGSEDEKKLVSLERKMKTWRSKSEGKLGLDDCMKAGLQIPVLREETRGLSQEIMARASLQAIRSPGPNVVILGKRYRFIVSKANGVVLGIASANREILSRQATDEYEFEPREGKKIVAGEQFDSLVEGTASEEGGTVFAASYTNPRIPGVRISKRYEMISDRIVAKRVEFRKSEGLDYKVSGVTRLVMDGSFRRGGLYARLPCAIAYPKETILTGADAIRPGQPDAPLRTAWIATNGTGLVLFTNRGKTLGLAQYQSRINDRLVFPPAGFKMSYMTPRGWTLSWFANVLKGDAPASCETRYHVFDGDRMRFHTEYIETSGLRDAWNEWSPHPKANRIQGLQGTPWGLNGTPEKWAERWDRTVAYKTDLLKRLARPGDLVLSLTNLTWRFGALPVSDESIISVNAPLTENYPASKYAGRTRSLANSPMLLGMYLFPWEIVKPAGIHEQHPDWILHNRRVRPAASGLSGEGGSSSGFPGLMLDFSADGMIEWHVGHLIKMAEYMGYRVIYTDGAIPSPVVNWKTMNLMCQSDGLRFSKRLWRESRERDIIYFSNIGWTASPYRDVGFMESVRWTLWEDWRLHADAMAVARLYAPPRYIPVMLYWRDNADYVPFANTIVLLGLRPQQPPSQERGAPYVQIGHEMYGYGLTDVGLRPCYWMQKTDVEAYSLKREDGAGVLVTFLNHAAEPGDVRLSFDAEKATLRTDAPIYAWYMDAKAASAVDPGGKGAMVKDSGGGENHGKMYGGVSKPGKIGNALEFNGQGDHIDLGDNVSFDIRDAVTLEAWMNVSPKAGRSNEPGIIGKSIQAYQLTYYYEHDAVYFYCTGKNFSVKMDTGTWHHVAATYDGKKMKIYIDGEQKAAVSHTGRIATGDVNFKIGKRGAGAYFRGMLDEVRVYDRALSADEVRKHYHLRGTLAHEKGLVAHYSFDGTTLRKSPPVDGLFTIRDMRHHTRSANGRIEISIPNVEPNVAKQLYVSNVPAFVEGIAGMPTQVKAADVLGTSIRRTSPRTLTVTCERPSTILLAWPLGEPAPAVHADGKKISPQQCQVGDTPALCVDLPLGKHVVELR